MAYLRMVTRASRNYEGGAWASHDMAFRCKAANQRSMDWGVIDLALYNEAFTGQARLILSCRFCLADSHDTSPGSTLLCTLFCTLGCMGAEIGADSPIV